MRFSFLNIANLIIGLLMFASCGTHDTSPSDNAIYYWRTTLDLDDAERRFLLDNDIKRIYMRYFDVDGAMVYSVSQDGPKWKSNAYPNATIQFKDTIPDGIEVVPVVFITQDGINAMKDNMPEYAQKLYERVKAMSHSQDWPLRELQLDCDWTESTRTIFYSLCTEIGKLTKADGVEISSTIRLHQLIQAPPPVDKGVLMVYNTGSFKSITAKNSIFNKDDIKPYLEDNRLKDYKLPLDVAWPVYGWSVCFDEDGKFAKLWNNIDLDSIPALQPKGDNRYECIGYLPDMWNVKTIRLEQPSAKEISEVKAIIDSQIGASHSNILYHLDSKQLSKFSTNEIKDIYSAD